MDDPIGNDKSMQRASVAREKGRHIEALELFVDVLSQLDEEATPDAFYSRLCEAICRLTSLERAVIFRYDSTRRRVRAVGTHGMTLAMFADAHVTVESAPVARRALEEDRVIEASTDLDQAVSPAYAGLLAGRQLVCAPMAASGRWFGVVIGDRSPESPPLEDDERDLLWTLGKTAALAAMARIATTQVEKARQLQQRIDMAREIHDGVIQRLFGVSMALGAQAPLAPEAQERCKLEVQGALGDLREALQRPLGRPSPATGTRLLEEVQRLAAEHPDLGVVLEEGDGADVPGTLEPLAQSVLVEAVRNAHKHARPSRVAVRVNHLDGAFVLEVANDGVVGAGRRTGMGLRLAAFEALQHGGVLEFGERGEHSWLVRLMVPDDDG